MPLKFVGVLVLAVNAFAGEYAVLASGSTLHVDRHETQGQNVRLFANGGEIDLPASAVLRFEQEYVSPRPDAVAEAGKAVDPKALVAEEARRWNIPTSFLHAIVRAESGYDPAAVSRKGAIGLMQLMPETARQLGADPHDPRQNVQAGSRYLADLLTKYKDDPYQVRKAVAAYNAGPNAVDRYNGIPPYRETRDYVNRVIRQWQSNPGK